MKLSKTLAARKAKNKENIPAATWDIMERSTEELKKQSLSSKAIQKGNKLPDFKLPNSTNKLMSIADFTHDFLVISFYRGGWCPFCNMELRALQEVLPKLKKLNTELVAISPETPDHSLTTTEKNALTFSVLSDLNNEYATSLGLTFALPKDLINVYHSFNLHVDIHNGNTDYELPMPATYIINKNREILYSFIPEDYTHRLDVETILEVLSSHQNESSTHHNHH
ncbi:peroxiredoxin-like family protein [Aquimarina hainanensis]|uniref:Peroxiredoxin-like family protein n=1 Tax=Aquimarina hainanensis TaxID=1578017 RepID=A0ABW5NE87_9FLAO